MDFLKDFEIPAIGEGSDVKVEGFSIKVLLNIIIDFINKIIKFEF